MLERIVKKAKEITIQSYKETNEFFTGYLKTWTHFNRLKVEVLNRLGVEYQPTPVELGKDIFILGCLTAGHFYVTLGGKIASELIPPYAEESKTNK